LFPYPVCPSLGVGKERAIERLWPYKRRGSQIN
jgi:hypothetical protein